MLRVLVLVPAVVCSAAAGSIALSVGVPAGLLLLHCVVLALAPAPLLIAIVAAPMVSVLLVAAGTALGSSPGAAGLVAPPPVVPLRPPAVLLREPIVALVTAAAGTTFVISAALPTAGRVRAGALVPAVRALVVGQAPGV